MVQELSPELSTNGYGIVTLVTASYVLQAFRAPSGIQFFVTADLHTENLPQFLVSTFLSDPILRHIKSWPNTHPMISAVQCNAIDQVICYNKSLTMILSYFCLYPSFVFIYP